MYNNVSIGDCYKKKEWFSWRGYGVRSTEYDHMVQTNILLKARASVLFIEVLNFSNPSTYQVYKNDKKN